MSSWDMLQLRIVCLFALIVMSRSHAPDHCPGKIYFRQCYIACEKGAGRGYNIYNKRDGSPCKTMFLKDGACRSGRCSTGSGVPVKIYEDFSVAKA
ncbi:hypothetical protein MRX96_015714 [Rhipicephalus microplus]